jgi:steroid 5-alpha reductase family enzyme
VILHDALSPAPTTFLLLRVSGVALLERNLRASRPDDAAYVERTPAFVPWFPRRQS